MTIRLSTTAACLAIALSTAWSGGQAQQSPSSYMYILMVNMVGPPANTLWKMVGTQDLSDQDWERMKQLVARLSDLTIPVSAGGNSDEEAERASTPEWKNWAGKFTNSVSSAAHAVDQKDQAALVTASDALVEACEGCHTAFPPAAAN